MDGQFHYPTLDENAISVIARVYEANPQYFDHPDCPYDQITKDIFKGNAKFQDFDTHTDVKIANSDDLLTQITQLSKELKAYGQSIKTEEGTSASDRNTYFRLSVTLLEKLVDIKEKIANVKSYEQFNNEVLDIMDKILTPDQRTTVMQRLESLVTTPSGIGQQSQGAASETIEPQDKQIHDI